jgi:hypothetical protein
MWKNNVEPGSPQMTLWRMRITCWIPKAKKHTHTHSGRVTLIASPLQQRWHECTSMLGYTYIVNCLYTLTFLFVLSQFVINFLSVLGGYYIWHGDHAVGYTTDESALDFTHNLTKRFELGGPSKLHSAKSLEGTSLCNAYSPKRK